MGCAASNHPPNTRINSSRSSRNMKQQSEEEDLGVTDVRIGTKDISQSKECRVFSSHKYNKVDTIVIKQADVNVHRRPKYADDPVAKPEDLIDKAKQDLETIRNIHTASKGVSYSIANGEDMASQNNLPYSIRHRLSNRHCKKEDLSSMEKLQEHMDIVKMRKERLIQQRKITAQQLTRPRTALAVKKREEVHNGRLSALPPGQRSSTNPLPAPTFDKPALPSISRM